MVFYPTAIIPEGLGFDQSRWHLERLSFSGKILLVAISGYFGEVRALGGYS